MRKKLFFVTLLIASLLLLSSLPSVNANEDKLNISLEINIDERNNVNLMFFMGTGSPKETGLKQIQVGKWADEWKNLGLQFENTTQGRFEKYAVSELNSSAVNFTKNVLGIGGGVTVNSIQTANYSDGICIKMSVTISDTTLHPLNFLGTEYDGEKIEEIVNIKVKISISNAALETPLELMVSQFILFHYRLPTGEYMEYSSNTNTINVNTNPFFSPLGSFIILIVFTILSSVVCIYARRYMRGVRLGPEIWVLAAIFYFCAFIPLSIYLLYTFMIIGLVLSFLRLLKAVRTAKPKVKPKKVSPTVSGDAVEKYLGKEKKPKPKPEKIDEEAERAYRELHKYSETKEAPGQGIVKKEEEKKDSAAGKERKIDIGALLKPKKKDKEKELTAGKEGRTGIGLLLKQKKDEKNGLKKGGGDELIKSMAKKGFKKKEE